jgi:hypothetical protein
MLGEGPGILRAPTKLVRAIRLRSCQAVWLVIHDEIILDVPEDQAQAACTALEAAMSTTFLGAPITAEAKIFGPRWGLWVPRMLSRHATCTYSCTRPPSRSRRSGRSAALDGGGVAPVGGR